MKKLVKRFFVDRFEEDWVICEDENGNETRIEIKNVPHSVREGSVILYENGEFILDSAETELRRKNISKLKKYIYKPKKR